MTITNCEYSSLVEQAASFKDIPGQLIENIQTTLRPETVISDGYGEYILTRVLGVQSPIDEKTYEVCHRALLLIKESALKGEKKLSERKVIAKIDPTLRLTFVPRALYELCYLEKIVNVWINPQAIDPKDKIYFGDHGNDQDSRVIKSAYHLNQIMAREIRPNSEGNLTYSQITEVAKKKLEDLRQKIEVLEKNGNYTAAKHLKSLGIGEKKCQELVIKMIALECSSSAKNARILYRGGNLASDSPIAQH